MSMDSELEVKKAQAEWQAITAELRKQLLQLTQGLAQLDSHEQANVLAMLHTAIRVDVAASCYTDLVQESEVI